MANPWEQDAPVQGGNPWERDAPTQPEDKRNAAEKFVAGVRYGGSRAIKGVGDLLEGALSTHPVGAAAVQAGRALRPAALEEAFSPEQLESQKREADTGWGTAGQVATDVALSAVPANRVYDAVRAGTQALRVAPSVFKRSLAALAPSAVTGAATEAALTPGDLGDRGSAAAWGAAAGPAGELAGRVVGKVLTQPVRPSDEAKVLLREGVVPTVGQGARSGVIHAAEDLVAGLPVVGQAVRAGQRRAAKELERTLVQKADPFGDIGVEGTPREVLAELHARTKEAWDAALDKVPPVPRTPELDSFLHGLTTDMPEEIGALYLKIMRKHLRGDGPITGQQLGAFQSELGKLANKLATSERGVDAYAADAVKNAQQQVRETLLKDATTHLNESYRNFLVRQKAGTDLGTQNEIAPRVFQKALRAVGGKNAYARGEALLSPEVKAAKADALERIATARASGMAPDPADIAVWEKPTTQDIIDAAQILKTSPNGVMSLLAGGAGLGLAHLGGVSGLAAIPAGLLATAGLSRGATKAAFGETALQKSLADSLRRSRGAQVATGAALSPDNEEE